MRLLAKICAVIGTILVLLSLIFRIPSGFQFSARGIMEFTQTVLLLGICVGIVTLIDKKS